MSEIVGHAEAKSSTAAPDFRIRRYLSEANRSGERRIFEGTTDAEHIRAGGNHGDRNKLDERRPAVGPPGRSRIRTTGRSERRPDGRHARRSEGRDARRSAGRHANASQSSSESPAWADIGVDAYVDATPQTRATGAVE